MPSAEHLGAGDLVGRHLGHGFRRQGGNGSRGGGWRRVGHGFGVFGRRETLAPGTLLFDEGDRDIDFFIILAGRTEVRYYRHDGYGVIAGQGPRNFVGDTATITGQAAIAHVVVLEQAEVVRIAGPDLRRLLVEDSELSDLLVGTFIARRSLIRDSRLTAAKVVGSRFDPATLRMRELLTRNNIPHVFLDMEMESEISACMARIGADHDDLPLLVLRAGEVHRRPSEAEVARLFGVNAVTPCELWDMVVVGAGPAGLAASVYGASEGLKVATIDTVAPGGQASTSSKIENYLGFPTGISGRELADRAAIQAQKFGTRIAAPVEAVSLACKGDRYAVTTGDGQALETRSVVIASGARYRRLPIDNMCDFEGAGVYYAATGMEAQLCEDAEVAMVGGGNSAGQGAVYLAGVAKHVHLMIRGDGLEATMSRYLIRRIAETPNITLHTGTEIAALHGNGKLAAIDVRDSATGQVRREDIRHLFVFIGAEACTGWLSDHVALDDKGFVKTGASLEPMELVAGGWPLPRPPSIYETNRPRIYAVGDVRSGSTKRVASAVGEGSVVVQFIHQALVE